jgi:hypothetical protein
VIVEEEDAAIFQVKQSDPLNTERAKESLIKHSGTA